MHLFPIQPQREEEQEAERNALLIMRYAHFEECLQSAHLATSMEVQRGAKTIIIRGRTLADVRLWRQFCHQTHRTPTETTQLSDLDILSARFQEWLQTQAAKRYQALTTTEELRWLEQVIRLSITRRIMLTKYEARVHHQPTAFANPQVEIALSLILVEQQRWQETARLLQHIVRDPELKEQLSTQIQAIYQTLPPFVSPERTDPFLPALETAHKGKE